MRTKIVAGNWKMNLDHAGGAALARAVAAGLAGRSPGCEVVLLPPFTSIPAVIEAVRGSRAAVGAQDLYCEDAGAFTGEISGPMLRSLGCTHVLVGHSERRHVIGEGGELLARKTRAALRNGLAPIYCVGELLAEREAGAAEVVVSRQIHEGLEGLPAADFERVIVAYEPVWAIGTGAVATPADASAMHGAIRRLLAGLFGAAADRTRILYGGSVKPESAPGLLASEDVDGLLVGGASLKADTFLGIVPR